MRDRETIDSELRLIALRRQVIRERGGELSSRQLDELLDERLGHRAQASPAAEAVRPGATRVHANTRWRRDRTDRGTPFRRKGALRRFGPLAVLPLSLVAIVAAALAMMFTDHKPQPAAEPTVVPPPSSARPSPAAPKAPPPMADIVDAAFIDTLKHEGVPVPSRDYVTAQGHAVCDFLTRQPNFADAVRFVQGSSIWDASQSVDVTAGAIVSYCPAQYQPGGLDGMQPAFQKTLSDLQTIEGDLRGIQGDLKGIEGGLPALPGQQ